MTDHSCLIGRRALVTGAGRGIGRAIALAMAEAGADVAVNDLDSKAAEETVRLVGAMGRRSLVAPGDAARRETAVRAVGAVVDAWGGLDIAVNNAGVLTTAPFLDLSDDDWERTLAVNLSGAFRVTQEAARHMVARGEGGCIIQIASVSARIPLPDGAHYSASKAGLLGLSREAARALAPHGIRVNAICPGPIVSDMTRRWLDDPDVMNTWLSEIPLRRLGKPEDVAAMAVFLASPGASYITGQAFHVDGGKAMV